uniref:Uncharacterized protein n=1 Tax=Vitis vinifera TaxID=29760 RepID=F6I595_VITVI
MEEHKVRYLLRLLGSRTPEKGGQAEELMSQRGERKKRRKKWGRKKENKRKRRRERRGKRGGERWVFD